MEYTETNSEIFDFVRELAELNKEVKLGTGRRLEGAEGYDPGWGGRFFANVEAKDLVLPEGYYINDKGLITNKQGAFDSNYNEFAVGDMQKATCKVNDISEVNKDGYTTEELAMMSKKDEEVVENKDIIENRKQDTSFYEEFNPVKEEEKISKKAKYIKNAKAKVMGLYSKLFSFADFAYHKIASKGKKGDNEEITPGLTRKEMDAIELLSSKIKDDSYIVDRMSKESETFHEMFQTNPTFCIEKLKEYAMIKEFHDFALDDKAYDDKRFNTIMNGIIDLKNNNTSRANRLLQEARYGGVTDNQLQFLSARLEYYKNHKVDKKEAFTQSVAVGSGPIPPGGGGGGTTVSTPAGESGSGPRAADGGGAIPPFEPSDSGNKYPFNNEEVNQIAIDKENERLDEITNKYNEERAKLFAELDEYEQMFIDDAKAENINPGDNEFTQMIRERTVNQERILNYLTKLEGINMREKYDKLQDFEKMFVDDAKAENIDPSDNEFTQMINERTVNKERILNYYKSETLSKIQLENIEKARKLLNAYSDGTIPLEESSGRSL